MNIIMLLRREIQKCSKCGLENGFITFAFEFGGYGYLAGRNESGTKYCIVELLGNDIYDEFCKLYQKCGYSDIRRMQRMFAIACDPVDGSRVFFSEKQRVCSGCGSDVFEGVIKSEPAADIEYFDVSYAKWNSLDINEKRLLINEAYNDYIDVS